MAVRPFADKAGNIVPRKFTIEWYTPRRPDDPKGTKPKQHKMVVEDVSEAEANQMYLQLRRTAGTPVRFDPTVKDIAAEWLDHYRIDHEASTVKDVEWALVSLLKHFGSCRLSALTLPLFEQYMRKRQETLWRPPITGKKNPDKTYQPGKPISKSRINTELKYITLMIKWAVSRGHMLQPAFEIPRFKRLPKKTLVTPEPAAVDKLLGKCDAKTALAVMLYHDAGLRRTEGLRLRVDNVHLDQAYTAWLSTREGDEPPDNSYLIVQGKGNKERVVIVASDRLHQALAERIKEVQTGYLFLNPKTQEPYKDLKKLIQSAARRAGTDDGVYNHLFRHAHATNSLEAGKDLEALREDLGHGSIATTQRYLHQRLGHRRAQAEKLKRHLGK